MFAPDSPLEGDGFEPSVPREGSYGHGTGRLTATRFPSSARGRLVRERDRRF
jgi:hypothetical protein